MNSISDFFFRRRSSAPPCMDPHQPPAKRLSSVVAKELNSNFFFRRRSSAPTCMDPHQPPVVAKQLSIVAKELNSYYKVEALRKIEAYEEKRQSAESLHKEIEAKRKNKAAAEALRVELFNYIALEPKDGTEPNTSLEEDGATLIHLAKALGKDKEWLFNGSPYHIRNWRRVEVVRGRVSGVDWACKRLSGTLPKEIGSLNCLTRFSVYNNSIRGPIPSTMSNLTKLTELYLNANLLEGKIPMSLSHLSNLQNLGLQSNNFEAGQDIPQAYLSDINQCKTYWNSLRRQPALRLLNYGMKITAKRIESDNPATVSPIFAFMVNNSDLYDVIVSYLDPLHVCTESRNRLLRIWMGMGGDEDNLRRGYGDDVSRWTGVKVSAASGGIAEIKWTEQGLSGKMPPEIGDIGESLLDLRLDKNSLIGEVPKELGKLASLSRLSLSSNSLEGTLPQELGNLEHLTTLEIEENNFSDAIPSSFLNLTNLKNLIVSTGFTNGPEKWSSTGLYGSRSIRRHAAAWPLRGDNLEIPSNFLILEYFKW
eukprot:CAMPEP_0182458138 /NCGR_PEP_ID=MMETSP1319-20130603/3544_1 /TAXON_ID=172717 /ORGANISM="Bolidomonas pacifica, Strain RCC208" /LENGTH=535 /DNA_ID=CAMNT_0024656763 /DNA_START=180 /DNA_END=1784 /DNA_ORIENTATION=-